ncbi:hypothetical protein [Eubacterium limosum]|uniref:hypothetical protein n=1 Tax=Eubacterium limosum TaxID=1736 RepID=UPI0010641D68|nr:hypothetical protein [Eubacterium limosum]
MPRIRCETLVDCVQISDFDEKDQKLYEYLQTEAGMKEVNERMKDVWLECLDEIFGEVDDLGVECYFTLTNDEVTNA